MKIQPGPALDELLCKAAGIEPTTYACYGSNRILVHLDGKPKWQRWADAHLTETAGFHFEYEWSAVSTTGDGMVLLMAVTAALGWLAEISQSPARTYDVELRGTRNGRGLHVGAPPAFAYAAAQALGVDVEVSE